MFGICLGRIRYRSPGQIIAIVSLRIEPFASLVAAAITAGTSRRASWRIYTAEMQDIQICVAMPTSAGIGFYIENNRLFSQRLYH